MDEQQESAADQAKHDYGFNRAESWRLDGLAAAEDDRRNAAVFAVRAQVRATLAQAAATRLVAEELVALRRATAIGLPLGDDMDIDNTVASPPAQCPRALLGGTVRRCMRDAGHDGDHGDENGTWS